jgi:hypothetical protein
MKRHQINITESIKWLNRYSQETWTRSKFYRMRKLRHFNGIWRGDKNADHFTVSLLKEGCKNLGISLKRKNKKERNNHGTGN